VWKCYHNIVSSERVDVMRSSARIFVCARRRAKHRTLKEASYSIIIASSSKKKQIEKPSVAEAPYFHTASQVTYDDDDAVFCEKAMDWYALEQLEVGSPPDNYCYGATASARAMVDSEIRPLPASGRRRSATPDNSDSDDGGSTEKVRVGPFATAGRANGVLDCERSSKRTKAECIRACAAYGKICPEAARVAADCACEAVRRLKDGSRIFTEDDECERESVEFLRLREDDVVLGDRLGEGGFCFVNRCDIVVAATTGAAAAAGRGDDEDNGAEHQQQPKQEYAVKYLKRRTMADPNQFKHGAADLAVEAHLLRALQHEHIVRLHAYAAGSLRANVLSSGTTTEHGGFFIVIDRLYDTLDDRIHRWADADDKQRPAFLLKRWSSDNRERKRKQLAERIGIAYMIADAMENLHSLNITFRDLKPDNIGFDARDNVKLFDFGLATELKPGQERDDGTYELTGNTGSKRYMVRFIFDYSVRCGSDPYLCLLIYLFLLELLIFFTERPRK